MGADHMCRLHDRPAVIVGCRTRRASTRSTAVRNGEKTKVVTLTDTISIMLSVVGQISLTGTSPYGRRVLHLHAQFWPFDMSSIRQVVLTMQS